MKHHDLKTWPEYFQKVWSGRKNAELRVNDRNFDLFDTVTLREFDPTTNEYSGRRIDLKITYISEDQNWLQEGVCMFSWASSRNYTVTKEECEPIYLSEEELTRIFSYVRERCAYRDGSISFDEECVTEAYEYDPVDTIKQLLGYTVEMTHPDTCNLPDGATYTVSFVFTNPCGEDTEASYRYNNISGWWINDGLTIK